GLDFTLALLRYVVVLLCELSRRILTKLLAPRGLCQSAVYTMELVSTLQLCICNLELRLLGEVGRLQPHLPGICGPWPYLPWSPGEPLSGVLKMVLQFMAASVARTMLQGLWALSLSGLYLRHTLQGLQCISPIHTDTHTSLVLPGPLVTAAAVAPLPCRPPSHTHTMDQRYRAHALSSSHPLSLSPVGMMCYVLLFDQMMSGRASPLLANKRK
uniref:Uncharacterized protein n=1 Tax=Oncorhynchus kisutch TaxID=8019 RepID=A0A8C7FH89_ONCKI